eukprot:763116-Hanusia_phi.AAC.6
MGDVDLETYDRSRPVMQQEGLLQQAPVFDADAHPPHWRQVSQQGGEGEGMTVLAGCMDPQGFNACAHTREVEDTREFAGKLLVVQTYKMFVKHSEWQIKAKRISFIRLCPVLTTNPRLNRRDSLWVSACARAQH